MIKIKDRDYEVKVSLRTLFLYERLSGNNGFETHKTEDNFMLLYAAIVANNKGCELTYDDFIDACDEDPTIIERLSSIMEDNAGKIASRGKAAAGKAKKK